MLTNLHVKNIALIDEIDVEFSEGLNILTGETGAGKSIILGAVNLALGKKMTSEMIGNFGNYALVELVFEIENDRIRKELEDRDILLEEHQVIMSRKIMAGRSICKINGETCTTGQMKDVATLLMDIHGQHEHQRLLSCEQQLKILDEFGGETIALLKKETAGSYLAYQDLEKQLEEYQLDKEHRLREISFLEFEINEIEKAELIPQEDISLEKKYRKLSNSKKIAEVLQRAHDLTGYESENGAGELISRALREMSNVQAYDENLEGINSMILDIESMLNDFNRELAAYLSDLTFSEEEFYEIDQRLDLINGLKDKYGDSIEKILEYQAIKILKLEQLQNFEKKKKELEKCREEKKVQLEQLSQKLSEARKRSAIQFQILVTESLKDLNFADVDFEITFNNEHKFSKNGKDSIEFLIATNPGEAKKSLGKVVSGGELSRIMLAVKTLMADKEDTETQIFDEIDAGISGRTAQKVSEKMALIGKKRQIICITHLPQIAAMADSHFEINKSVFENVTTTQIFRLSSQESINEIARILGGAEITQRTLDSAKEMKDMAQVHKNTRLKI